MTSDRAFTLIGRGCLRQLLVNEPAARQRNAEALHQMRIGCAGCAPRFRLFSEVVTDDQIETIKAELKWLGAELAPARDSGFISVEALRPLRKQQADQPGFESISRMFARERLKAYRRAREAVESPSFARWCSIPRSGSKPGHGTFRTIR